MELQESSSDLMAHPTNRRALLQASVAELYEEVGLQGLDKKPPPPRGADPIKYDRGVRKGQPEGGKVDCPASLVKLHIGIAKRAPLYVTEATQGCPEWWGDGSHRTPNPNPPHTKQGDRKAACKQRKAAGLVDIRDDLVTAEYLTVPSTGYGLINQKAEEVKANSLFRPLSLVSQLPSSAAFHS